MAEQVPKPITKAITEYKIIFKDFFLSSDIKIKRKMPNKKVKTLIKVVIPPNKTKNPPISYFYFIFKSKIIDCL
ncbi:hypothetical protein IRZ71_18705 [Flavobacterium sp. ANB]|uniref:hypothetical protein n=1 Tax=unclassified Flavobacterium TaxID=196869 RepID=UPI00188C1B5B|nr:MULTISPECIES: hypothetical protein [unclassified Flavobacterium]MBF4518391.1 hypothetical protein [Flavobacterium sp. ANB]